MRVGVDFDNTIVCYDELFHRVALERDLVSAELPATKGQVRDYLRRCGKEESWIELQGQVYGARMEEAMPFPDVLESFARCRQHGITVYIISHRTRYPFRGAMYDLHQAAFNWLESHGFYDAAGSSLSRERVFFELTKQEKIDRIAQTGCGHFVDDLPEFLLEPTFPSQVERILFDPNGDHPDGDGFHRATSWPEIDRLLTGLEV